MQEEEHKRTGSLLMILNCDNLIALFYSSELKRLGLQSWTKDKIYNPWNQWNYWNIQQQKNTRHLIPKVIKTCHANNYLIYTYAGCQLRTASSQLRWNQSSEPSTNSKVGIEISSSLEVMFRCCGEPRESSLRGSTPSLCPQLCRNRMLASKRCLQRSRRRTLFLPQVDSTQRLDQLHHGEGRMKTRWETAISWQSTSVASLKPTLSNFDNILQTWTYECWWVCYGCDGIPVTVFLFIWKKDHLYREIHAAVWFVAVIMTEFMGGD